MTDTPNPKPVHAPHGRVAMAAALGVSVSTVDRHVKSGDFPHTIVGVRYVRFTDDQYAAIVENWATRIDAASATPR